MKYKIIFGLLTCLSLHVSGQITRGRPSLSVPSLSEILRDTGALESAVVDLSRSGAFGRGAQDGFAGGLPDVFSGGTHGGSVGIAQDGFRTSTHGGSVGMAQDGFRTSTHGGSVGMAQDGFRTSTQGGSVGMAQDGFRTSTHGGSVGMAQGGFRTSTQGGSVGMAPHGFRTASPGGFVGVALDGFGGGTPGGSVGVIPDGFDGSTPGGSVGVVPDGFGGSTTGGFVGVAQDGFGGGTPGGSVGVVPDGFGGSTPGGSVGVVPGGFGGSTPGGSVRVVPDGFGGSTPGGFVGVAQNGFGGSLDGGHIGGGQDGFTPIDVSPADMHGTDVKPIIPTGIGPTVMTDIRGNAPPPPTGRHVDLPGEHGNTHDFAVVHRGEAPMQGPTHVDHTIHANIPVQQGAPREVQVFHPEGQGQVSGLVDSTHTMNTMSNTSPEHPFRGNNVHHGVPASGSTNFDNLAAIGNSGLGFADRAVPSFSVADLLELPPEAPVITRDHVDAPPIHVLPDVPNPPRTSMSKSDGFFSPLDVVLPSSSGVHMDKPLSTTHADPPQASHLGIHIDEPNAHGNMLNERALHLPHGATIEDARDAGVISPSTRVRRQPGTLLDTSIAEQKPGAPMGSVHVDMPGQHGVPRDGHAVVHREGPRPFGQQPGSPIGTSSFGSQPGAPMGSVHVDMPAQHGVPRDGHAVVHREREQPLGQQPGAPIGTSNFGQQLGAPIGTTNFGQQPGAPVGNVHVDMPGQHGVPRDGQAVIHREGPQPFEQQPGAPIRTNNFGQQPRAPIGTTNFGHQPGAPMGNVHVDMPGQHGVPRDGQAVIHREGPQPFEQQPGAPIGTNNFGPQPGSPMGSVHVDMPGQHGVPRDGHPVVHRERQQPLGQQPGAPIGTNNFGPQPGSPMGSVHVDMPGQHGVPRDGHPVVHRERQQPLGQQPGAPIGTNNFGPQPGSPMRSVHVDMPGQHGVPRNGHAVVHRQRQQPFGQQSGPPMGSVHVDMPGQHGVPRDGRAVIHREGSQQFGQQPGAPIGTSDVGIHSGTQIGAPFGNTHVDMPGQHGTPINGMPTVHRGPGLVPGPLPGQHFLPGTRDMHIDVPSGHPRGFEGTIPRLAPVLLTGVIPGTANVPIRGRRNGHVFINQAGPDRMPVNNFHGVRPFGRSRHLGGLLGIPPGRLSDSVGLNNFQRSVDFNNLEPSQFGVADNRSGLRSMNGGLPTNILRGGRSWRPTSTITSVNPRHPGIAMIRPSHLTPLAASGVVRNLLTIDNSGAGGLLGSVFRTIVRVQRGLGHTSGTPLIAPIRLHPVPTIGIIQRPMITLL